MINAWGYDVDMGKDKETEADDTLSRLHKTLNTIREENPAASGPGPLAAGMESHDRLVVASFFDPKNARLFQNALGKSGVGSSADRRSGKTQVLVDYEDRDSAVGALSAHLQDHPNRRLNTVRRDFDGLIFGLAIGLTCGFIFGIASWPDVSAFAVSVPFLILGCLLGHLYDRLRYHLRTSGRLRIGIWELMILTALPAAGFLLRSVIMSVLYD